jgi:hypothetical protein
MFINGTQSGSTNTATMNLAYPSIQIGIFCVYKTSAANFYQGRLSAYSFGLGLTAAKVASYNTALAAFRSALGRA